MLIEKNNGDLDNNNGLIQFLRKYILTLQLIITQEVQQIVQVLLNIMVVLKHCQELGFSIVVVILHLEYLHFMD